MGDVFFEQLVKKKSSGGDLVKKILIAVAGMLLCFLALNFLFIQPFGSFALIVAVGAIYLTWFFITSLNLEFEYIYTNGEMDVDKIMAKRKRKRITTVKISSFEEFGRFNMEQYRSQRYDVTINAAVSMTDPDTYYGVFHNRDSKRCILIFSPDERLLPEIEKIYRRRAGRMPG